ncbi:alpha/beta hydrolase family protein [Massilia yuzhufengensis]|uniref:Predicted alpha/beta hydrolase n=1 Tax=Massilia yuzhufengensis TaxID=1164594 RepID=A0A1I1NT99_9BURK|nr:alpha/beta hydrolase [Massilia yuzhufengensis]SFC98003.1 Predicted alpha/beta hydrolase [Massilia yuzhufengensis]
MNPEHLSIPAGRIPIEATCWSVPGAAATVVLHPATAVTQTYYEPFAAWMAGQGFNVVTYDYRGIGRSRPHSLRGMRVTMSDWMDKDVAIATRWAEARFPGLPLLALGHSVGGHAIGLSPETARLRAAVLVASHAGASRTVRGFGERLRVRFMLRVLAPVLCALFGYMPGRRFGLGEDLPRGVMLQWASWTALPRYFFDDPKVDAARRMARVTIPLLVLGFDDDPWANPQAVDMLVSHLAGARIERRNIDPRAAGVPALGHMGFFRRRCEPVLWKQVANWLHVHAQQAEVARHAGG